MQNLSQAEITTLAPVINALQTYATNNFSRIRNTTERDNRINYCTFVLNERQHNGMNLCHDNLLSSGASIWNNNDCRRGTHLNYIAFFVPEIYRNQEDILARFSSFMQEIQEKNEFTDEEIGAISHISTLNNGEQFFIYKIGTFFKTTQGNMYVPVKLFRLAITCNDNATNLSEAMTQQFKHDSNDRASIRDFSKILLESFYNLKDLGLDIGFLSAIRSKHTAMKNKIDVAKKEQERIQKMKEKEEKAKQKMTEIQSKVMRKKQVPIMVLSRHPSHSPLRHLESTCRILVRLGSTTSTPPKMVGKCIEINSIEGVQNSSSKLRMKAAFAKAGVQTSMWCQPENEQQILTFAAQFADKKNVKYVTKSEFGSRGEGNRLHDTIEDVISFFSTGNKYGRYIIEKYYSYNKEYRLHVSITGKCFYSCRKMLKKGTPEDQKWVRNDSTCVWIMESNEMFEKPRTWDKIVENSVLAIKAVGLDVGAVDVRVNNEGQFVILETNSAPSFGDVTLDKYYEELPQIAWKKMQTMSEQD